jgi:hypothetical protein
VLTVDLHLQSKGPQLRKLVAVLVAAICLVPALAFAADPAKNSAFRWCENSDSCPFAFETSKNGRYIKDIMAYNDCARVPATFPRVRVKDDGSFSKTGTVTDVINQKLTYTFKGRFTRPKKAVGTYDVDRKGCTGKPVKFVAKRFGKAQAGI